jgi:predicted dinucleotide-binding enzyme
MTLVPSMISRRDVLRRSLISLAMLSSCPLRGFAQAGSTAPLKIGIIGTGRIGGALAEHWVAAGHEVFMSSRHPEELVELAEMLGPRAHAGTPAEAAAFGDVMLVSVPYAALPQIGVDLASSLRGKIVLDTSNPVERRDGEMAIEAQRKGSGVASAELLPGTRLVRAFNCIPAASLRDEGNRKPERYAIPLAGDDAEALAVAQRLVDDAGFDSVVVGNLESARLFDLGQPLARQVFTAAELRAEIAALR